MSRRRRSQTVEGQRTREGASGRGPETRDLPLRAAVLSFAGLVVVSALFLAITVTMQYAFVGQLPCLCPPTGVFSVMPTMVPTAVARRQNPQSEVEQYLSDQNERLHTYGWVDQSAGVVHIPIERAMDLLLQRGLPTRPQAESDKFADKGDVLPSYSSSGRTTEEWYR